MCRCTSTTCLDLRVSRAPLIRAAGGPYAVEGPLPIINRIRIFDRRLPNLPSVDLQIAAGARLASSFAITSLEGVLRGIEARRDEPFEVGTFTRKGLSGVNLQRLAPYFIVATLTESRDVTWKLNVRTSPMKSPRSPWRERARVRILGCTTAHIGDGVDTFR